MRVASIFFVFLFVPLTMNAYAAKPDLVGQVVRIFDGDTITVADPNNYDRRYKIRLAGVDAPERRQDGGIAAHKFLNEISSLKHVSVYIYKSSRDHYPHDVESKNLILADVYRADGARLNEAMVRYGHAWWEPGRKDSTLENAQALARQEGRGIWEKRNPVPPWEWRAEQPFAVARKWLDQGLFPEEIQQKAVQNGIVEKQKK
jgi:endonuclease YncB( thermonuclease family)